MCNERENLVAYLYDEADANERRDVEAHLSSCEDCREELRAFRAVRQDLLAWDVPQHESVWTPFATARPQPIWRQVPAWSLAAAAMLVFALGGAGGFAGRALAARSSAPVQVAAMQPPPEPVNVTGAASADATSVALIADLHAVQARLGELERATSVRTVSAPPASMSSASNAALIAQVEQLIRDSEGRVNHRTSQKIVSMMQEIGRQRTVDNAMLQQQISDAQERTNGSILAVKNQRTEKEKE